MISICTSWTDRHGSASLHQVEIEIAHLILVSFSNHTSVCSETLIEAAKNTPKIYPALTSMEQRRAIWHVSSTLKRLGFTRRNSSSKYWELKE